MGSLRPEVVFSLLGAGVTNSLIATLLVDAVVILLIILLRRNLSLVPGTLQAAAEGVVEYIQATTEQVAGERAPAIFPWVAVFFIYIAISNLLGLLPGFGTIGFFRGGSFVPLLRAATADLNTTLALAVVSVLATHALAIRANGVVGYLKHFFAANPLFLFVGLLEIVQEFTKLLSFSFRLFGNISAGEQVLGTIASLFAFIVPVPFLALEILVGVVQAMIFALLTMAFMSILTEPAHKGGM